MFEIREENVEEVFTYHAPTPAQVESMGRLREAAKAYAKVVLAECPRVPDRTRCLNMVKDSNMLANAAIILDGVE